MTETFGTVADWVVRQAWRDGWQRRARRNAWAAMAADTARARIRADVAGYLDSQHGARPEGIDSHGLRPA